MPRLVYAVFLVLWWSEFLFVFVLVWINLLHFRVSLVLSLGPACFLPCLRVYVTLCPFLWLKVRKNILQIYMYCTCMWACVRANIDLSFMKWHKHLRLSSLSSYRGADERLWLCDCVTLKIDNSSTTSDIVDWILSSGADCEAMAKYGYSLFANPGVKATFSAEGAILTAWLPLCMSYCADTTLVFYINLILQCCQNQYIDLWRSARTQGKKG